MLRFYILETRIDIDPYQEIRSEKRRTGSLEEQIAPNGSSFYVQPCPEKLYTVIEHAQVLHS